MVAGQTGTPEVVRLEFGEWPLWVRSRHRSKSAQCLLYPQKRTFESVAAMTALCQKQILNEKKFGREISMIALGDHEIMLGHLPLIPDHR